MAEEPFQRQMFSALTPATAEVFPGENVVPILWRLVGEDQRILSPDLRAQRRLAHFYQSGEKPRRCRHNPVFLLLTGQGTKFAFFSPDA